MSEEFEDYFTEVENSLSQCAGGRDLYALKLVHKNYFRIKTGFYEDESPEEISNEICMSINEMVKDGKVTCNNCQWEWKLSEGGNDPYTCHKCGYKKNQLLEHLINERSVTDLPVRTIVREMTDIVKKEIRGEFYLPEDSTGEMNYEFEGLPLFTIEFNVTWDGTIDGEYIVDGTTVDEGDTIVIVLVINPSYYPKNLYGIIGDLNDIVRHEIEHVYQDAGYRDSEEVRMDDEQAPTTKDYYKQSYEIPAEIKGFRRLVKLRKQSPEKVIKDWFKRSKPVHQLSDEDIDELTTFLSEKYYEYYGRKS